MTLKSHILGVLAYMLEVFRRLDEQDAGNDYSGALRVVIGRRWIAPGHGLRSQQYQLDVLSAAPVPDELTFPPEVAPTA